MMMMFFLEDVPGRVGEEQDERQATRRVEQRQGPLSSSGLFFCYYFSKSPQSRHQKRFTSHSLLFFCADERIYIFMKTDFWRLMYH